MGFSGEDPTATAEGMTASGLFFPATKVGEGGAAALGNDRASCPAKDPQLDTI